VSIGVQFRSLRRIVAIAVLLGTPRTAAAQEAAWPAARSTHAMVWHDRLREVLLLGGAPPSEDSALWAWNGRRWRVAALGGAAGRAHFAMGYDAARNRLVVQGGFVAAFGPGRPPQRLGDTWEWDGRAWRQVSTGGPGVRDHHTMAYDPARRQLILFGGSDSAGTQLGDTWTWNGRAWRRLASDGPPGRSTHRMAFDTRRGVLVLFGGWGAGGLLNDTWEWNGRVWRRATDSAGPSARFATRMAYDPTRGRTVLFGGRGPNGDLGDTWEWDGRAWTQRDATGPSIRNIHEMVFDPNQNAVLLFGGFNAPLRYQDLWAVDQRGWRAIPRAGTVAPAGGFAANGPYPVGYRAISHWDRTRQTAPARDYAGTPNSGNRATPMQVSVWYPAQAGGTPMRLGEYHALGAKRETLEPITDGEVTAASATVRGNARFMLRVDLSATKADSISASRTAAVRDAAPAAGRFPLVVGGLEGPGSAYGLAEHLASFGYVVVSSPSLAATATLQVTNPQVALETQARNLEVVQSLASELPFVDPDHLALVGMNFDGLAVLVVQMRNMTADAVVSVDGWESKSMAHMLRASPHYDPARVRVPYLAFSQANPPSSALAFADSTLNALKYSTRYGFVVRDIEHGHLLGNLMVYPELRPEARLGYDFIWRTIRNFLDANLKDQAAAKAFLERSAVENGYPGWLVQVERKHPALEPIPTAKEVEQIAMAGNVSELTAIYRRAKAVNPSVTMFTLQTLNLYAFRFGQRGDRDRAIAFQQLAVEAFPTSTAAANNLGNAYRDAGQMAKAIEFWEKAVALIDADPELPPAEKQPSRTNLETKIMQARRS
jgi:hypothetical protein